MRDTIKVALRQELFENIIEYLDSWSRSLCVLPVFCTHKIMIHIEIQYCNAK